jgi:hypothetical protein
MIRGGENHQAICIKIEITRDDGQRFSDGLLTMKRRDAGVADASTIARLYRHAHELFRRDGG